MNFAKIIGEMGWSCIVVYVVVWGGLVSGLSSTPVPWHSSHCQKSSSEMVSPYRTRMCPVPRHFLQVSCFSVGVVVGYPGHVCLLGFFFSAVGPEFDVVSSGCWGYAG